MTDRETVVVKDGGSSAGVILGIIAIIVIVAAVWYFAMGPGAGRSDTNTNNGPTINVEVPTGQPGGS